MIILKKNMKKPLFLIIFIVGILIMAFAFYNAFTTNQPKKQFFLVFEMFLGLCILFIPDFLTKITKFIFPEYLKNLFYLFILFSVFLGTGLSFYGKITHWDKILHFSSAMLLVAFGIGIAAYLLRNIEKNHSTALAVILFGFFFAMTIGVFWEFYEFSFDGLLGLNMQRFATSSGKNLIGREALFDTMGDLFINTFGALVFTIYCWIQTKKDFDYIEKWALEKRS